jgi:hypothetical protein
MIIQFYITVMYVIGRRWPEAGENHIKRAPSLVLFTKHVWSVAVGMIK